MNKTITLGACMLLFGIVSSSMILSMVPPVDRDALTHHLYVPKLYLKHGGMTELPDIEFSYYPMNLDLLYIIPLYLGNDMVPKFIHMMFGLLTAALVYRYLSRRIDSESALIATVFFLSTPVVFRLSFTVYVDLGLMCFSFASLFYLFQWARNRFRTRDLIVAGLACGLALGTKYNGLVVMFLLTAATPVLYSRMIQTDSAIRFSSTLWPRFRTDIRSVGYGLVFLFVALLVFSPWMIRNLVWQGNPLYPLYPSAFVAQTTNPDNIDSENQPIGRMLKRKLLYEEPFWETLTVPIRIFFQGQDDNPRYFDGKLNPLLAILPLFILLNRRMKKPGQIMEETILAAFSILFILIAFVASDMRIRYVAPVIAPLAVLSVMGIRDIQCLLASRFPAIFPKLGKWITIGICTAFLLPNILYIRDQFKKVDPLPFIQGHVSRDDYIQRHRPEYAAIQFINQNLNDDAVILGMFLGKRGYYFDRTVRFDDGLLQSISKTAIRPGELADRLEEIGITHLLTHEGLFNQWLTDSLTDRERNSVQTLIRNHLRLIYQSHGFGLYEITRLP